VKEKPTVGSPLFGALLLTSSLRRRRMSMYISLFRVTITVNYTSGFRELFEAATYNGADHPSPSSNELPAQARHGVNFTFYCNIHVIHKIVITNLHNTSYDSSIIYGQFFVIFIFLINGIIQS